MKVDKIPSEGLRTKLWGLLALSPECPDLGSDGSRESCPSQGEAVNSAVFPVPDTGSSEVLLSRTSFERGGVPASK